jgi:hypothetical protein
MDVLTISPDDMTPYETQECWRALRAGDILAQAETGSVVIIVS